MRLDLAKHGFLFNDKHFVAYDPLKLNNIVNTCLMKLSII